MKPLSLELAAGAPRQLKSLGWKTPNDGDARRHFFALSEDGRPLVVTPQAAVPDFYDPGRRVGAVFSREPFPEAVCVEISPCRLLPPPCFQSREDFEGQAPCFAISEPWKAIYLKVHHEFLVLEPAYDGPLQARLDQWLTAMRRDYERATAAWRDQIKHLKTGTLKGLGLHTEARRRERLRESQAQLDILESKTPIEGVPCRGRLKLTLADVQRGCEGIRDAFLHECWAGENHLDLRAMRHGRRAFVQWLETHTGTPGNVYDSVARETRMEIVPPGFGEGFENDPRFLEACAKVRYRARFADSAGTVVYLANCGLREELMAAELNEAAQLRVASVPAPASVAASFRPSPDYRQLFWIEDSGTKVEAHLTSKQAAAFSALHNAANFVLSRGEWRQEIYGDASPADFRPDKLFHYRDGRKVWQRFIRVAGDRYRLVFEQA